jgi:hypothetical protein
MSDCPPRVDRIERLVLMKSWVGCAIPPKPPVHS